jgi:hypothetical protein
MKSLKTILIVSVSSISSIAISQPPPPGPGSKADSLINEANIVGAVAEYRKIYKADPKDQRNVYNYACAFSVGKKVDSCFKYLEIAVRMDTSIAALIEPDLLTIRKDTRWQDFENNLVSMLNRKFHNPYPDIEYAKKLWKLRALDQAYFTQIGIAGRKTGMKSSVVEALWDFKFMIQERNQEELGKLIAAKGWPRVADVGSDAAMAAYLTVMHSNDGMQKEYLPVIKKICEEKELSWERYAMMYDRSLYNENKPQKYGTHTRYNEKTDSAELYPLEDETKVDEWRKELGLEPLAEYMARFNIKYQPLKK